MCQGFTAASCPTSVRWLSRTGQRKREKSMSWLQKGAFAQVRPGQAREEAQAQVKSGAARWEKWLTLLGSGSSAAASGFDSLSSGTR